MIKSHLERINPCASVGNVDLETKSVGRGTVARRVGRDADTLFACRDSVKRFVCDIVFLCVGRATDAQGLRPRCSRTWGIVVLWACSGPVGDQKTLERRAWVPQGRGEITRGHGGLNDPY